MATTPSPAASGWHNALKLRKYLTRQLEKLSQQNASTSGIDVADFEAIESTLEKFRFTCVHTIFLDLDYAIAENTEQILWLVHTSVNTEYRKALARLKQSSHAVERRKVEKAHHSFLRIAQKFYKGFIQRLASRYDVQELKRAAQGIQVEHQNGDDTISPVSAELQAKVLKYCHATLIHLGDLARYRTRAKPKRSDYSAPLTYYSLAQDLLPTSGFAFHQMAIINIDEGKHLDVVYHFYRAWAVADPHPLARSNLESEFKTLATSNSSNQRSSPGPYDAFIMWFVRLHARFYKGEIFSQHAELEGEVVHRLEMASKNPDSADVLMKMSLTNISAYYVASQRYMEKQEATLLQHCQYTLRLNVRFILAFCTAIASDVQDNLNGSTESSEDAKPAEPTPISESLLPIMRIYTMWLATHRQEIFGAVDALGVVVPTMVKALARLCTLLCAQTSEQDNLAFCPYLLKEDLDIRGLKPLSPEVVPERCRCYNGENGLMKPHLQMAKTRLEPSRETSARILDILCSAYFLADDPNVPLKSEVLEAGLTFSYQEVSSPSQLPIEEVGIVPSPPSKPIAQGEETHFSSPRTTIPTEPTSVVPPTTATSAKKTATPVQRIREEQGVIDAEHADNTVFEMLAPFLKPPTPQPHQGSRSPEESSYGMHTSTCNEIFGAIQPGMSPNSSIPSGKFEPLPWNWVYTPTPSKGDDAVTAAGQAAFATNASPNYVSHGTMQSNQPLDDPFCTPGRGPPPGLMPRSASNGSMLGSPHLSAEEQAHRNLLLQSFTGSIPPRTSNANHWAQHSTLQMNDSRSPSWGSHPVDGNPFSSASAFSHPSSLYQGTPNNQTYYGVPTDGTRSMDYLNGPISPRNATSMSRQTNVQHTTSSYDAAILQAALHGNK